MKKTLRHGITLLLITAFALLALGSDDATTAAFVQAASASSGAQNISGSYTSNHGGNYWQLTLRNNATFVLDINNGQGREEGTYSVSGSNITYRFTRGILAGETVYGYISGNTVFMDGIGFTRFDASIRL